MVLSHDNNVRRCQPPHLPSTRENDATFTLQWLGRRGGEGGVIRRLRYPPCNTARSRTRSKHTCTLVTPLRCSLCHCLGPMARFEAHTSVSVSFSHRVVFLARFEVRWIFMGSPDNVEGTGGGLIRARYAMSPQERGVRKPREHGFFPGTRTGYERYCEREYPSQMLHKPCKQQRRTAVLKGQHSGCLSFTYEQTLHLCLLTSVVQ